MTQAIQILISGIIISLFISTTLLSQDQIVLKGGQTLTGNLIQYEIGRHAIIQTHGDTQVIVPTSTIRSITDDSEMIYGKAKKVKALKIKESLAIDQWYFDWENKLYINANKAGVGISLSYLYQWKHFLAAGVGAGYDNYNFSQFRSFIPVFVQARSYVKDAYKSPYLDVKLGYGFATQGNEQVVSNDGGLYTQTSVGLRFGSGGFKTTAGIGIQFQNNQLEAFHPWNGGIVKEDRQYRRIVLNLGFIF